MNCKQGDIAEVVETSLKADLRGIRIICTKLVFHPTSGKPHWVAERKVNGFSRFADSKLKPINPKGEQDEMLRIAGLPQRKEKERVKL
jgi:hypothetical protein